MLLQDGPWGDDQMLMDMERVWGLYVCEWIQGYVFCFVFFCVRVKMVLEKCSTYLKVQSYFGGSVNVSANSKRWILSEKHDLLGGPSG